MAKNKSNNVLKLVVIIATIAVLVALITVGVEVYIISLNAPNNYVRNQQIINEAIQQKNPALCDQIVGDIQDTYDLPTPSGVQKATSTYNQDEARKRCKAQAASGQNYVY